MANEEVQEYYEGFSPVIVRAYLMNHGRIRALYQFVRDCLPANAKNVLIIGCGGGDLADYIVRRVAMSAKVTGLDISETNIGCAQKLFPGRNVTFLSGDAIAGLPEGPYDAIILPDTYEHIPLSGRSDLHKNLARALSSRGRLILTVPSPSKLEHLGSLGWGLQVVDEKISLEDVATLASDVGGEITHYSMICVSRLNDYIHIVIEKGADIAAPLAETEKTPIKRSISKHDALRYYGAKCRHICVRAGRSIHFARRFGLGSLRNTLSYDKSRIWKNSEHSD